MSWSAALELVAVLAILFPTRRPLFALRRGRVVNGPPHSPEHQVS